MRMHINHCTQMYNVLFLFFVRLCTYLCITDLLLSMCKRPYNGPGSLVISLEYVSFIGLSMTILCAFGIAYSFTVMQWLLVAKNKSFYPTGQPGNRKSIKQCEPCPEAGYLALVLRLLAGRALCPPQLLAGRRGRWWEHSVTLLQRRAALRLQLSLPYWEHV